MELLLDSFSLDKKFKFKIEQVKLQNKMPNSLSKMLSLSRFCSMIACKYQQIICFLLSLGFSIPLLILIPLQQCCDYSFTNKGSQIWYHWQLLFQDKSKVSKISPILFHLLVKALIIRCEKLEVYRKFLLLESTIINDGMAQLANPKTS